MIKILTLWFLLFSQVFAEVVTTTKVSTSVGVGVGVTREEAVDKAVLEAIGQLEGVSFKAQTLSIDSSIQSTAGNRADFIYNSTIEKATQGKVDSYSILGVTEIDGGYEAQVEIKKVKTTQQYKAPDLSTDSRRKIAVMPFSASLTAGGENSETSRQLSQNLVSYFTQTRRFAILDRDHMSAFAKEKGLILSGDMKREEHLKLGQALGADYLVVGNVANATVQDNTEHSRITGQNIRKLKTSVRVDYRILVMSTRQVKWSDTVQINEESSLTGNNDSDAASRLLRESLDKSTQKIVGQLMNNIYPAKVVQLQTAEQQIVINQGGNSVQEGDKYQIFREGKAIVDPYTKESLGKDETLVADVEIVRVTPKMAYAKFVSGNFAGIKENDTCRPAPNAEAELAKNGGVGRASSIQMDEGGGVKLPFD